MTQNQNDSEEGGHIDEYARVVIECRKKRTNRILSNWSLNHAAILIDNLLELAIETNSNIYMISGEINKDFYNQLLNKFVKYLDHCVAKNNTIKNIAGKLDSNIKLHVIIANSAKIKKEGNSFFTLLESKGDNNKYKDCISLMQANLSTTFPHFFLVKDIAYRLETDHEFGHATASFNDAINGSILKDLFEYAYSKASNGLYTI